MDNAFIYCILAGIGLVFLFCAARFAFRWIIRLAIAGLLFLLVIGGAYWWYGRNSPQVEAKPRPATSRRENIDRR